MYSAISQRGCEPLRDSLCEAATLAHTLLNDLAAQIEELPERTTQKDVASQPSPPNKNTPTVFQTALMVRRGSSSRPKRSKKEVALIGEFGGRFADGAARPGIAWATDVVDAIRSKSSKVIFENAHTPRHLLIYPNSNDFRTTR
jgi:hypothetical protein